MSDNVKQVFIDVSSSEFVYGDVQDLSIIESLPIVNAKLTRAIALCNNGNYAMSGTIVNSVRTWLGLGTFSPTDSSSVNNAIEDCYSFIEDTGLVSLPTPCPFVTQ